MPRLSPSFSSFQAPASTAPTLVSYPSDRRGRRMTVAIPREDRSSHVSRFTAGARLNTGPGLSLPLVHPHAAVRQNPRQDRPDVLGHAPSCPQTGARHAEHRPPHFAAIHAYGVH